MKKAVMPSDGLPPSRQQLIQWLRQEFDLNITKIEDCGNGAVYVLVMDKLLYGIGARIPVHKLRWDNTQQCYSVENYKILQQIVREHKLPLHVDVNALMRCKLQDNLIFLQNIHKIYMSRYEYSETYPGGWTRREDNKYLSKFLPFAKRCEDRLPEQERSHQPLHERDVGRDPTNQENNLPRRRPLIKANEDKRLSDVDQLKRQVEELQETNETLLEVIRQADEDITNMNKERAAYYVQLLKIDRYMEMKRPFTSEIPIEEVEMCISGHKLPAEIEQFADEFNPELYIGGDET